MRTSARGAGTRQAPCAQASHISSQEASKATDSPASTRSPGPSGASCRNSRASASTNAAAERCETATPLGVPVEPEVKMTQASSAGAGGRRRRPAPAGRGGAARTSPSSPSTTATSASVNTSRARSSGSSTSTGTYAAPAARVARIATYSSAVPEAMRMPTRSPGRDPLGMELGGAGDHLGSQLAVGEDDRAVVDRRCRAVGVDARAEDVDERARRPRLAGAAEPVTGGLARAGAGPPQHHLAVPDGDLAAGSRSRHHFTLVHARVRAQRLHTGGRHPSRATVTAGGERRATGETSPCRRLPAPLVIATAWPQSPRTLISARRTPRV